MEKVFELYIKTTPEKLWEAITSDAARAHYHFGVGVESDWAPGSRYECRHPHAPEPIVTGEVVEAGPPLRLVTTFLANWSEDVRAVGSTRVTWEIEEIGDSCKLLLTHDRLPDDADPEVYGGWPQVLSSLKTYLETGETLTTPGSLMYG